MYLHLDGDHLVIVSTDSVQLWSGGQHRVKLGVLVRDQESVQMEGLNRKAFWASTKRLLAVLVRKEQAVCTALQPACIARGFLCHCISCFQHSCTLHPGLCRVSPLLMTVRLVVVVRPCLSQTYHSVLHIYGVHTSKEAVLSAPALLGSYAPEVDFKRANIYLQHSITLTDEANAASATDVVADARTLLVSFSNGTCQLYSWAGKVGAQALSASRQSATAVRRQVLQRWCPNQSGLLEHFTAHTLVCCTLPPLPQSCDCMGHAGPGHDCTAGGAC